MDAYLVNSELQQTRQDTASGKDKHFSHCHKSEQSLNYWPFKFKKTT